MNVPLRVFVAAPSPQRTFTATEVPLDQVASAGDAVLQRAVANASHALQLLSDRFGWRGMDGTGTPLSIYVHAPSIVDGRTTDGPLDNAYWDDSPDTGRAPGIYLGDGSTATRPYGDALDVVTHELGHAVLAHSSRIAAADGATERQSAALAESFGDVLGVVADGNWTHGEALLAEGIPLERGVSFDIVRSMTAPIHFTHMSDAVDRAPAHQAADVPNLAAARAATAIGMEAFGRVWFDAFTRRLATGATFADAARATTEAARTLVSERAAQAVSTAWSSVGVAVS